MWTVVYVARSREIADELKSELEKSGVLVRITGDGNKESETEPVSGQFYEVSVTSSDVETAHDFIIEHGY